MDDANQNPYKQYTTPRKPKRRNRSYEAIEREALAEEYYGGGAAANGKRLVRAARKGQRVHERPLAIPPVNVDMIPQEMRHYAHFVLWQREWDDEAKDGETKWRKVPMIAGTDSRAKSNTPSTWCSWPVAVKAYTQIAERAPGTVGMGYVFAKSGHPRYPAIKPNDEDDLVFIDLDHCRDPQTGEREPWATEIIERFKTYSEASPSEVGVHAYVRGQLSKAYKVGNVEMYAVARFTTLTGAHLDGTPTTINANQEAIDWLVERLEAEHAAKRPKRAPKRPNQPTTVKRHGLTDAQLVAKIRGSKQGPLFHDLYDDGDWASRYPSQSEGVWALLGILAWWTQCDTEQMDRLFRTSALMSGKWLDKWDDPRGDTTLGASQIAAMIDETGDDVYGATLGLNGAKPAANGTTLGKLMLRAVADIVAERTTWLFPGYLPGGELAALAGAGGAGKTSLALAIAVAKAGGLPLPGGAQADVTGPMGVIYLTSENHPAKVLRPRIEAEALHQTGGDRPKTDAILGRIYIVQGVVTLPNGQPLGEELAGVPEVASVVLPRDTEALRAAIREQDVGLVIIDPIISFSERDLDVLNPADMRKLLDPMARLAQEEDISVWALLHFTKAVNTAIIMRISLSRQMTDTTRAVGVVLEDPNDPRWRWLAMVKNNLGADPPAYSFALQEVVHPTFTDATSAVVAWGETRHAKADKLEHDLAAEAALHAAKDPFDAERAEKMQRQSPVAYDAMLALANKLIALRQSGAEVVTAKQLEEWRVELGHNTPTWSKARGLLHIKTTATGQGAAWEQRLDDPALEWLARRFPPQG